MVLQLRVIALLLLLALTCSALAAGQEADRIIELHPGTPIDPLVKVADNPLASSEIMALEIVDVLVAGKPVALGKPFAAEDDWMRGFSVRVKNVSGKPIMGARMQFSFPEAKNGESTLGSNLEYGRGAGLGKGANESKVIMPGEEVDLIRTESAHERDKRWIAEKSGVTSVRRVWLGLAYVKFEDGILWIGRPRMKSLVAN